MIASSSFLSSTFMGKIDEPSISDQHLYIYHKNVYFKVLNKLKNMRVNYGVSLKFWGKQSHSKYKVLKLKLFNYLRHLIFNIINSNDFMTLLKAFISMIHYFISGMQNPQSTKKNFFNIFCPLKYFNVLFKITHRVMWIPSVKRQKPL